MAEKVVIIGAGSAMFTRGLVTDLARTGVETELVLVDIDTQALAAVEALVRKMIAAWNAKIRLSAHSDRREALPDATIVIATIGVGGRRAWEQDVFVPRKYGIFQPVGDSVMPGGTSRALRMIPPMVDIARDVLDLAPDALFFNYSNPMAPICRAVRKATCANMVGLCHGVWHTAGYLASHLGVDAAALEYSAVGMNHLTWFTDVRIDGKDVMPQLREIAADGVNGDSDDTFSWQLLHLFGGFPAPLDRHVTEFFPQFYSRGSYNGKTLGVDAFSFEECIALGDRIYGEMEHAAFSDAPLSEEYLTQQGGEHEQVIGIIDSIRNNAGRVYSANLPNTGQVSNLPIDSIVESPCIANSSGMHPIPQPPLPTGIAATLATRMMWVELVTEAALEGDRDKFVQALVVDGAVESMKMAQDLADDLLSAQAQYLPQFA